ncbi:hypothetical protein LJC59_02540 [Desulfovibrio sp. OttesenSCG-928-A18]|nr:hypothetical protein [Desulfovibrio sp. OttesenSCG-928-A18]
MQRGSQNIKSAFRRELSNTFQRGRNRAFRHCPALAVLVFSVLLCACAGKRDDPEPQRQGDIQTSHVERRGVLPGAGTVVLYPATPGMLAQDHLFLRLNEALAPVLVDRGLRLAQAPHPRAEAKRGSGRGYGEGGQGAYSSAAMLQSSPAGAVNGKSARPQAGDTAAAAAKSRELAASGKLARLSLDPYILPERDQELPASVLGIRPLDSDAVMQTLAREGVAPAALSPEARQALLAAGAGTADYLLLCRLSVLPLPLQAEGDGISARKALLAQSVKRNEMRLPEHPEQLITAAGPIRGVGTMGYGRSAAPARPAPPYGGGQSDFTKGREGNASSPPDFFGREADLKARDFQLKYGPPPEYAIPPAAASPGVSRPPAALPSLPRPPLPGDNRAGDWPLPPQAPGPSEPSQGPGPGSRAPAYSPASGAHAAGLTPAAYVLALDCYDLRPLRAGGQALLVWSASARQPAQNPDMAEALPGLISLLMQ